ncbi:hypothetical protein GPA24_14900 [Aromatoleum bremense]|uniref:Uncharacterized protein n=1 Tax=Aromatoleum bremense TaxID=76115 RepID=A0ABX1NZ04_9RHOO|nr:hypothetical protein [Aromatoleum bremense]
MPSWTGSDDEPFNPKRPPATADLGIVPETFWRLPGYQDELSSGFFASSAGSRSQSP